MEVPSEISGKEIYEEKETVEPNVENLKESIIDVVKPNKLDKILEELVSTNVDNVNERKSDMLQSVDVNVILDGLDTSDEEKVKEVNVPVDVVQSDGIEKILEDFIKPNLENVIERKQDPTDMDKMLENCNKYLNECEEVLQGCAKYLEECDDTETVCHDKEESNPHDKKHSEQQSDRDNNIPEGAENDGPQHYHGDNVKDDSKKEVKKKGKNKKQRTKGKGGNNKSKENKEDGISKSNGIKVPNNNINMSEKSTIGLDTNQDAKVNNVETNASLDLNESKAGAVNDINNDGEPNIEPVSDAMNTITNKNQSKSDMDAVEMKLNLNQSDDSDDDGEDTMKLVPLKIQEEFDVEMERIKNNMEQLVKGKDTITSTDDKETVADTENEIDQLVKTKEAETSQNDIESVADIENEIEATKNNNLKLDLEKHQESVSGETNETAKCVDNSMDTNSAFTNNIDSSQIDHMQMDIKQDEEIVSEDGAQGTSERPEEPKVKLEQEPDQERDKNAAIIQNKMKELEDELAVTKTALRSAHNLLAGQQTRSNNVIMTLKIELYKTQAALKQEKIKSHQQLSDVISHLTFLEGNLRKCQIKHRKEVRSKNEMIEIHQMEVLKLREQNEQLLNAIKEICANGGMNGYMREKQTSHSEKKGHNGKLGMVKDKFLMKNRSSLELNNFNLEKFNLKNQRLCSSQEDLKNLHDDAFEQNSPGHEKSSVFSRLRGTSTRGSKQGNKNHRKNLQNFFTEPEQTRPEMNKSNSDSSQISDTSSGVFSMSDQDLTIRPSSAGLNGHDDHFDYDEDDDDDGRFFSFSSTHINTVIDEEEALGNSTLSYSGHMMSMGSMPMLAQVHDDPGQRLYNSKDRPHSLSSVDLVSIQRQAEKLSKFSQNETITETPTTPPPSPNSHNNNKSDKSEMTPFQTFKTMFKRKGNKNKVNKKRSVSLSQTTNNEYSEALKKHFQKYDMH